MPRSTPWGSPQIHDIPAALGGWSLTLVGLSACPQPMGLRPGPRHHRLCHPHSGAAQPVAAGSAVTNTARVMGRRAEGAAIGATEGAALISALILGAATMQLDAYEISDTLV